MSQQMSAIPASRIASVGFVREGDKEVSAAFQAELTALKKAQWEDKESHAAAITEVKQALKTLRADIAEMKETHTADKAQLATEMQSRDLALKKALEANDALQGEVTELKENTLSRQRERLFRLFSNPPPSWRLDAPLSSWEGITLNGDGVVIAINLGGKKLSGTLHLEHLKLFGALVYLYLSSNQLSGGIDLTKLPGSLVTLDLRSNQLSGGIDLTKLPDSLVYLYLSSNQLSGGIDLTKLPDSLVYLYLSSNQLSGGIDLTKLPDSLVYLYLHSNQLSGGIDLTKLPDSLVYLYLQNNQLSGGIDLTKLPGSLVYLYLHSNQLSGAVDLTKLPSKMKNLNISSCPLCHFIGLNGAKAQVPSLSV